jgi:glycosyltransferase involved in cell wall biosynthesis
MRIAIVNWNARLIGGAETYLDTVALALARAGHELALFCELDSPVTRPRIWLPPESEPWCASTIGAARAVAQMRAWKPDIVYGHGLTDPVLEAQTIETAPSVLLSHDYRGTCISGGKTLKFPLARPCSRHFGWQCLVHFYPRRCGGLSLVTMMRQFQLQSHRLELIRRYDRLVVASNHMRREYLRHGLAPHVVETIPLPIGLRDSRRRIVCEHASQSYGAVHPEPHTIAPRFGETVGGGWRLLFAGRMVPLKGGLELMEALPLVCAKLGRPIRLTLAGDGPARATWEERARKLLARNSPISIDFTGWLNGAHLDALAAACDLFVMPSLWPEPFGLGGVEMGLCGLPAAAFAVGGIPEWLSNGVNGYLAPGDPPTVSGLAEAIIRCLRDPDEYARLRVGAIDCTRGFTVDRHVSHLIDVFADVISKGCDAR